MIGYLVVLVFFGGLGTWAALAHIAEAAIAPGIVSPDGSRKTVQHLEGGIIAKLMADDGDHVKQGDPLVLLEETQARAAFQVLRGERRLLAAKLARLLAEQANQDAVEFPDWLLADEPSDPEVQKILQAQRDLFAARHDLHEGRKAIGGKRIEELEEEILGLQSQVRSQREQIALLDEELAAKKKLVDRGMLARPEYLALQRLKAEIEGDAAENVAGIARARQTIGETELQVVNEDANRLDQIVTELADTRSELAAVEEKIRAQRDVLDRTVVTAPVSGVVMKKRFFTTGGVVGPGQPILDIVPDEVELLIDARVRPVDIDTVQAGQRARVHFLPYSERRLPQIWGNVRSVSADSLVDEATGEHYFLARVEVPTEELDKLGPNAKVTPGMPAEVLIMTGDRTVLQYLVQPILDSLRRTFREA
jgi:HlyD family secretion protein/epimerase transport system membrane fusion protein